MASLLEVGLDGVVVLPAEPADEVPPLLPQAARLRVSDAAASAVSARRGFMSYSDFVDPFGFSRASESAVASSDDWFT
jgi:hypothetical protein